MSVYFKQGVMGFEKLTDETRRGFGKVAGLYKLQGLPFMVTSVAESTHSASSLHYFGRAFDFTPQGMTIESIRATLGKDWDVIDEGTHIHCEYDPK